MSSAAATSKRWIRFLPIFGLWTLIGLSFAGQFFISSSQMGRPAVSWHQALSHSLADWYVFALLSVIPLRLARRFGLDGPDWGARFAIHFMTSIVFSVLFVGLRSFVALWQPGAMTSTSYVEAFKVLLGKTWHFNLLIYWVILSVAHALELYRKFQERVTRTAELERRLAEAVRPAGQPSGLILYGCPGNSYRLERATGVAGTTDWQPWKNLPMLTLQTNLLPLLGGDNQVFFRAAEFQADPPFIELWERGGNEVQWLIYSKPGQSLFVERTTRLSPLPLWDTMLSTNPVSSFVIPQPVPMTNQVEVFRVRKP